jgi:hypothetical protein
MVLDLFALIICSDRVSSFCPKQISDQHLPLCLPI